MRSQPIRVLELRSVRGTGGGPEKTILRGAAVSDAQRFAVGVCYIRDVRDDVFAVDRTAVELGVDYVEVTERHSFDPRVWPALRRLVGDRGIQIVHSHDYKTNLLAWLLARAAGVTPIATSHGWTGNSLRERLVYYPGDRQILRLFPRVIAVSDQIRDTLVQAGARPDRVTTVLNGIDPSVFKRDPGRGDRVRASLGIPISATVIGSVSRLETQKRFDLLIEAFARVRGALPDARLVIAGDGSLATELSDQAARLGLGASCMLIGHRTDVVDVLHTFDLFVQSSDYEGTPNAVLEAMAVEAPVVATTAGGTAQLIDDRVHGLLVQPGRGDLLGALIMEALGDRAASQARASAARQRVERELSFEARMQKVEALYERLLVQRPPTGRSTRTGA